MYRSPTPPWDSVPSPNQADCTSYVSEQATAFDDTSDLFHFDLFPDQIGSPVCIEPSGDSSVSIPISTTGVSWPGSSSENLMLSSDEPNGGVVANAQTCQLTACALDQRNSSKSLPRRRSKYLIRHAGQGSAPIWIPSPLNHRSESHPTDPLQRWKNSPPEMEPASMSAIYSALTQAAESNTTAQEPRSSNTSPGCHRAASATSFNSGGSASSMHSGTSAFSGASATSTISQESRSGLPLMPRGRARQSRQNTTDKRNRYQCTFCCDTFKQKHDWSRHEKSLHLWLEEWICAPHGGSVFSLATGRTHCAYCNALDPTPDHVESHNFHFCRDNSIGNPSFRRKDHLVQHLKHVHKLEALPLIDDWKVTTEPVTSRCGFCDLTMATWQERTDHLAVHFRKGAKMASWKGDHGFDPAIAARVTNAMSPYLIGDDAQTLIPFSATSSASQDLYNQISSLISSDIGWSEENQSTSPKEAQAEPSPSSDKDVSAVEQASCKMSTADMLKQVSANTIVFTEILTLHLGRYARQQVAKGICPTDEMFQQESRRVLFDSEDLWNQTVTDNPQWMAAFRQRHGLEPELDA